MSEAKKTIRGELVGMALLGLAFFVFLSLVSYSPEDASFTHYSASTSVSNIFGVFGSHFADLLRLSMGRLAYLLPLFLFLLSLGRMLNKDVLLGREFHLGSLGILVSAPYIAHFIATETLGTFRPTDGGGLLGAAISRAMAPYFGSVGTLLIALAVLALATVMVTNLSLLVFVRMLARSLLRLRHFFRRRGEIWWRQMRGDHQEKASEPVIGGEKGGKSSPQPATAKAPPPQERFDFYHMETSSAGDYILPHLELLDTVPKRDDRVKREILIANSKILEAKLADFDVKVRVTEIRPGPVVTTYEVEPAAGIKISKVTSLNNDLGLALRAVSVRIAPIAGKGTIGIEIPNSTRETVCLKSLLESDSFREAHHKLSIALGDDVVGVPIVVNLEKMPHLLIAGTTGSGKSVCLNAMICSILYKAAPDEVKFLMIDPKRIELSSYEGIPHLLHPVVVDPKEAANVLRWAVEEMERRYTIIGDAGARNIEGYNRGVQGTKKARSRSDVAEDAALTREFLPYIVIVLDELADLMMVASRSVETSLARLAQKARAAGIHIIVATQRPSVDVITGVIKANFPTRVSFHVSSKVDSRTVLDQQGAEDLLGSGDMLFMSSGSADLMRVHGAFVSEKEIERVVGHIKKQRTPIYDPSILEIKSSLDDTDDEKGHGSGMDEHYQSAMEIAFKRGEISISFLQRQLNIGYNRAAKLVERMENEGLVGPADGSKMRKVIRR